MSDSAWTVFDAVFWISLAGIMVGLFGLIIKVCLKSKCEHFKLCWGLISVDRRVDLEVEEEIHRMDVGVPDDLEMPTIQPSQTQTIKRPSLDSSQDKNKV